MIHEVVIVSLSTAHKALDERPGSARGEISRVRATLARSATYTWAPNARSCRGAATRGGRCSPPLELLRRRPKAHAETPTARRTFPACARSSWIAASPCSHSAAIASHAWHGAIQPRVRGDQHRDRRRLIAEPPPQRTDRPACRLRRGVRRSRRGRRRTGTR